MTVRVKPCPKCGKFPKFGNIFGTCGCIVRTKGLPPPPGAIKK